MVQPSVSSSNTTAPRPIPEIPTSLPVIGHFIDLIVGTPWTTIRKWFTTPDRIASFKFFGGTYIILANPDSLRRVLATNVQNYKKDAFTYASFMPILGNGLVTSSGELWKRQRAILGKVFRADILTDVVRIADEAVSRLINELEPHVGSGRPVDFVHPFRRLTLQVIADAVLSLPPEVSDDVLPRLYIPIVHEANQRTFMPWRGYIPTTTNREFNRAAAELDAFVTEIIERRKVEGNARGRKDLLDRIIAGHLESGQPWDARAVAQIRDEVKTFLVAGHETSSMMLTWALHELARHPAAMERTIVEANEALPRGAPAPVAMAQGGLEYTLAVLKETLREYSLVPAVTREAIADDVLGGFHVPKGAKVLVAIDAVHHDPTLWPEPDVFRPERFLAPPRHQYAFLAFLAGSRSCIGEAFSLIEGKIVLARLVQRFRFLAASRDVGERDRFKVPVVPATPLAMHVEEHASA